ncbi:MAG TPA: hypothetical protein DCZ94_15195 [Lentisphaeria bacterium]|nr:MAG: hypothetical protein A2X48_14110 [Lentisphaerae bacterium GWF2_49_21]HBC88296.1 hypothetical protein [Lentisphaeria bacterium]
MIKLLEKHIPFLILAPFLCFFSGIMMPHVLGFRAAILGLSVAAAGTAVNILNREELSKEQPPTIYSISLVGIISGMVCGLFLCLTRNLEFFHSFPVVSNFVGAASYNILILIGYRFRFIFKHGRLSYLAVMAGAAISYGLTVVSKSDHDAFITILLGSFLGAFPFALLWFIAASYADPAYNYGRWKKKTGQEEEIK